MKMKMTNNAVINLKNKFSVEKLTSMNKKRLTVRIPRDLLKINVFSQTNRCKVCNDVTPFTFEFLELSQNTNTLL